MADTMEMHANMVAFWNGVGGDRWINGQKLRDGMLQIFAEKGLAAAKAQAGESVIDIGCGLGETSILLAQQVGPSGAVVAADVSAPILEVTKQNLKPFPWAQAVVADASTYPFEPASADLLFSRFGVMFFGDPTSAFANMKTALKPGGRLAFVCWRTGKENRWMSAPQEVVFQFVDRPPPPAPDAPGPLSFADPARVKGILEGAGFTDVVMTPFDTLVDMSGGRGVEGAVRVATETGAAARLMDDAPGPVKAKIVEGLAKYFAGVVKDQKVMFDAAVWIVTAKA